MVFLKRIVIFVILSLLIAFSVPAFAEYMIGILATDLKTHSIDKNVLSTYPLKNHHRKTVTLAFTGDIMMGTNYPDTR